MKKHPIVGCLLAAFAIPCLLSAQKPNPAPVTANPYYSVKASKSLLPDDLPYQAFVTGRKGDTLLLFSGRTNGLHNFSAPAFPVAKANDSFVVFIPAQRKVIKADVASLLAPIGKRSKAVFTATQLYQLQATNLEYCQSGDTLYCFGGYGFNGSSMVTFGGCFAINVPRMIDLVLNGGSTSTTTIKKALSFASNADLLTSQITGGELLKTNNSYYLVVGQTFTGEYSDGSGSTFTQNYVSTITPYSFKWLNDTTFNCLAGQSYPADYNNLHRRDLNVVPVVNSKGTKTFHIYGGVFTTTLNGGPYLNPVEVTDTTGSITIQVDNIKQYFNQYAAAHISIFDASKNQMYTTILGGITLYDSVGNSANNQSVATKDSSMPWSKVISTIVKNNTTGVITEYASDNERLPDYVGGEAKFIPYKQFLLKGSDEIVDMAKIKAAAKGKQPVKIGIMFGGIVSSDAQGSKTKSSRHVYDVHLTPLQ